MKNKCSAHIKYNRIEMSNPYTSTNEFVLEMYNNLYTFYNKIESKFNVSNIAYNFILTDDGLYFIDTFSNMFMLCDDIRLESNPSVTINPSTIRYIFAQRNPHASFVHTNLNLYRTYNNTYPVGFLCFNSDSSNGDFYIYKGFKKDTNNKLYLQIQPLNEYNQTRTHGKIAYEFDNQIVGPQDFDTILISHHEIINTTINNVGPFKMFMFSSQHRNTDQPPQTGTLETKFILPSNNDNNNTSGIQFNMTQNSSTSYISQLTQFIPINVEYIYQFAVSEFPKIHTNLLLSDNTIAETVEYTEGCIIYINNLAILCTEPSNSIIPEEIRHIAINNRFEDIKQERIHAAAVRSQYTQSDGTYVRIDQGRQMDPSRTINRQLIIPQPRNPDLLQQQSQQMIDILNRRTEHLDALQAANTGIPRGTPNRLPQRTQGQLFPSTQ